MLLEHTIAARPWPRGRCAVLADELAYTTDRIRLVADGLAHQAPHSAIRRQLRAHLRQHGRPSGGWRVSGAPRRCCSGCFKVDDVGLTIALYERLKMKKAMLLLLLAGCTDPPPSGDADTTLPQLPSVSIDQLQQIPGMPRDENGNIILLEVAGGPLTFGAPGNDAISAAAKCRDLLSSCVGATKDADGCVTKLPICAGERPWEEALPCCPQACVTAYQEERRLGADVFRSAKAVFASTHECFPGLQELYRAAGGTPYLAPRLAPR